jgi:nitrate reductase gamma subunit
MELLLEFAKGPLFIITFIFMILGLARRIYLQAVQIHRAMQRLSYNDFSFWAHIKSLVVWLIPITHIYKNRPTLSIISFVFHIGLLVVPIFFINHIVLWTAGIGISWPGISLMAADVLTFTTLVTGAILLFYRIFDRGVRSMSSIMDYMILVILLIPFVSGFMACHPWMNPVSYGVTMLIHVLSSELVFLLLPTTKMVHCVLFMFDRLSSDVFWKMPVGAGEKVARELHGKQVKI